MKRSATNNIEGGDTEIFSSVFTGTKNGGSETINDESSFKKKGNLDLQRFDSGSNKEAEHRESETCGLMHSKTPSPFPTSCQLHRKMFCKGKKRPDSYHCKSDTPHPHPTTPLPNTPPTAAMLQMHAIDAVHPLHHF